MFFNFPYGTYGSTSESDYKRVPLVALNMWEWGYMSLAAYKYSLPLSLKIKHNQPTKTRSTFIVGCLGFYPQWQRKGKFVSSKPHVSPPTHISSDQGNPLVVRPGSRTQVTCTKGEKPNRCPTDLTRVRLSELYWQMTAQMSVYTFVLGV